MENQDVNALGYFFASSPNLPLRQKLALAMMARNKKFPTNLGEGIASIGQEIGDALAYRSLLEQDKAAMQAAATAKVPPIADSAVPSPQPPQAPVIPDNRPDIVPPRPPQARVITPPAPGTPGDAAASRPAANLRTQCHNSDAGPTWAQRSRRARHPTGTTRQHPRRHVPAAGAAITAGDGARRCPRRGAACRGGSSGDRTCRVTATNGRGTATGACGSRTATPGRSAAAARRGRLRPAICAGTDTAGHPICAAAVSTDPGYPAARAVTTGTCSGMPPAPGTPQGAPTIRPGPQERQ